MYIAPPCNYGVLEILGDCAAQCLLQHTVLNIILHVLDTLHVPHLTTVMLQRMSIVQRERLAAESGEERLPDYAL